MKKGSLAADAWMKEVAPSTELRKWFDHRVERWEEFRRRYRDELNANSGAWESMLNASKRGPVTLLYSAHDSVHNGAAVLRDYLVEREAGDSRGKRPNGHRLTSKNTKSRARFSPGPSRAASFELAAVFSINDAVA